MAYINFKPQSYFNTITFDGTASSGNAVTGVGFQPDMTWLKDRVGSNEHYLGDSVRGSTKQLIPNTNAGDHTASQGLQSFNADGFTVGSDGDVNPNHGTSYHETVAWNWKMGTTSGLSGGTITPSAYSINTTAKQGIYKYTGNGTLGQTIAHGLGQAPKFVMVKNTGGSYDWALYHANADNDLTQAGDYFFRLNTTVARDDNSGYFNDTITTDTLVTLGSDNPVNHSGNEMIMYAFCNVDGYFRASSYMGNGNVNGSLIHTGFTPAMVIIKRRDGSDGWNMWDNKRTPNNLRNKYLEPDYNGSEQTGTSDQVVDFLSNGFKIRGSGSETNTNGGNYIYVAWASNPMIGSNGTAGVAI